MTCQDLMKMLQERIDFDSQITESETRMTAIYLTPNGQSCVARVMSPVEGKTRVMEIQVKELCVYEGLKPSSDQIAT